MDIIKIKAEVYQLEQQGKRKRRFARNGICRRMNWITKLCGFLITICFMRGFSDKFCGE